MELPGNGEYAGNRGTTYQDWHAGPSNSGRVWMNRGAIACHPALAKRVSGSAVLAAWPASTPGRWLPTRLRPAG